MAQKKDNEAPSLSERIVQMERVYFDLSATLLSSQQEATELRHDVKILRGKLNVSSTVHKRMLERCIDVQMLTTVTRKDFEELKNSVFHLLNETKKGFLTLTSEFKAIENTAIRFQGEDPIASFEQAHLCSRIQTLERELRDAQKAYTMLQSTYYILQKQSSSQQSSLATALEQARQTILTISQIASATKLLNKELAADNEHLRTENDSLQKALTTRMNQLSVFKERQRQAEDRCCSLESTITQLKEEIKILSSRKLEKIDHTNDVIPPPPADIEPQEQKNYESLLTILEENFVNVVQLNKNLEKELKEAAAFATKFVTSNPFSQKSHDALRLELDQAKLFSEQLKLEKDETILQLQNSLKEAQDFCSVVDQLRAKNVKYENQVKVLNETISNVEQNLVDKQQELARQKAIVQNINNQLKQVQQEKQTLSEDLERLQTDSKNQVLTITKKSSQALREAQTRIHSCEAEIESLKKSKQDLCATLEVTIATANREKQEHEQKIKVLEENLANSIAKYEKYFEQTCKHWQKHTELYNMYSDEIEDIKSTERKTYQELTRSQKQYLLQCFEVKQLKKTISSMSTEQESIKQLHEEHIKAKQEELDKANEQILEKDNQLYIQSNDMKERDEKIRALMYENKKLQASMVEFNQQQEAEKVKAISTKFDALEKKYKQKVQEMNQLIAQHATETTKLRDEIVQLQAHLNQAEENTRKMSAELEETSKQFDNTKISLMIKIKHMTDQRRKFEEQIANLEDEKADLEEAIESQEGEMETLIAAHQAELKKVTDSETETAQRNHMLESELQKQRDEIQNLNKELLSLKFSASAAKKMKQAHDEQVTFLKQQIDSASKELETTKKELEVMKGKANDRSKVVLQQVEAKVGLLETTIESQTKQLQQARTKEQELVSQKMDLENKLELAHQQIEDTKTDYEQQLSLLKDELVKLRQSSKEQMKHLETTLSKSQTLSSSEIDALKTNLENAKQALQSTADLKVKYEQLQKAKANDQTQIQKLTLELDSLNTQLRDVNAQLDIATEQVKSLSKQNEKLLGQTLLMEADKQTLEGKLRDAQRNIDDGRVEQDRLKKIVQQERNLIQKQTDALNNDLESVKKVVQEARDQLKGMKEVHEQHEAYIAQVEKMKQKVNAELTKERRQIQILKAELTKLHQISDAIGAKSDKPANELIEQIQTIVEQETVIPESDASTASPHETMDDYKNDILDSYLEGAVANVKNGRPPSPSSEHAAPVLQVPSNSAPSTPAPAPNKRFTLSRGASISDLRARTQKIASRRPSVMSHESDEVKSVSSQL